MINNKKPTLKELKDKYLKQYLYSEAKFNGSYHYLYYVKGITKKISFSQTYFHFDCSRIECWGTMNKIVSSYLFQKEAYLNTQIIKDNNIKICSKTKADGILKDLIKEINIEFNMGKK